MFLLFPQRRSPGLGPPFCQYHFSQAFFRHISMKMTPRQRTNPLLRPLLSNNVPPVSTETKPWPRFGSPLFQRPLSSNLFPSYFHEDDTRQRTNPLLRPLLSNHVPPVSTETKPWPRSTLLSIPLFSNLCPSYVHEEEASTKDEHHFCLILRLVFKEGFHCIIMRQIWAVQLFS